MVRGLAAVALAGAALSFFPSAGAASVSVAATDDDFYNPRFEPSEASAPPGAQVEVRDTGKDQHTFTSVDGAWPEVTLAPGEVKSIAAPANLGDFRFYCRYHASPQAQPGQGMAGVLHVTDAAAPPVPPRQPTPLGLAPVVLAVALAAFAAAFRR